MEGIINYLEKAYARAKSVCDYENMERLARAINAFKAPLDMNIFSMPAQNKISETLCQFSSAQNNMSEGDLIEEALNRR